MNTFLSNSLIADDTKYYTFLVNHEHILREHIHFATVFQQERITTWWRFNKVYCDNIDNDMLVECDISYVWFQGMLLIGTIETDRLDLAKNKCWIKLYDIAQAKAADEQ